MSVPAPSTSSLRIKRRSGCHADRIFRQLESSKLLQLSLMNRPVHRRMPAGYTKRRLIGRLILLAIVALVVILRGRFADPQAPDANPTDGADFDVRITSPDDQLQQSTTEGDAVTSDGKADPAAESQEDDSNGGIVLNSDLSIATAESPAVDREDQAKADDTGGGPSARGPPGSLWLVAGTKDEFLSSAGLLYLPGSADQHRLKHLLKHAEDDRSKRIHGVFDGNREQILKWVDQAWLMYNDADETTDQVRSERQGTRTAITVDLQQPIGFVGGQVGQERGHPPCRYLRLVVQNENEVVTAYPVNRW